MKANVVQRFKAVETRVSALEKDLLTISRAVQFILDDHQPLKKKVVNLQNGSSQNRSRI